MKAEDYNILNFMMEEFQQEKQKIEIQIKNNLKNIKIAETHIEYLQNSESEDFKIFSPRKKDAEKNKRIEIILEEKSKYEQSNLKLNERRQILISYIDNIDTILKHQNIEDKSEKEKIKYVCNDVIHDLDDLILKINEKCKYIEKNPVQAKQDFVIIGRYLRKITDKLRNWQSQDSE